MVEVEVRGGKPGTAARLTASLTGCSADVAACADVALTGAGAQRVELRVRALPLASVCVFPLCYLRAKL